MTRSRHCAGSRRCRWVRGALFGLGLSLLGSVAPALAETKDAAARSWLREERAKAEPAAPGAPSRLRLVLLSGLVLALAAGALIVKRRRRMLIPGAPSELTVVTAARVGGKAQVVVVSVAGRKLLLGVTDAQVSSLGWLDAEPGVEDAAAFDGPSPALGPAARTLLAAEPRRVTATRPRGFRDVLMSALGRTPIAVEPALALAAATEDVVTRSSNARVASPAGAPEMVDVEGQARGLVLRLQKRA